MKRLSVWQAYDVFVVLFVLITIFFVNAAEAKSLKKGEVYSLLNGRETMEVISKSELEITERGTTFVAEYEFKGDKLRVVASIMGTKQVQYYLLTEEGLREEQTGNIYYSKTAYAAAKLKAAEARKKAELQAKREREKAERERREAEAKRQMGIELLKAVRDNNIDIARQLLDKGANPNTTEEPYRNTPLTIAVNNDNAEMVQLLLNKGANANAKSKAGNFFSDEYPILMHAIVKDRIEIINLLLSKGADVNAKSSGGKTVLVFVTESGRVDLVKLLLARNVNVNTVDNRGYTPLDVAQEKGYREVSELLIAAGAKESQIAVEKRNKEEKINLNKELFHAVDKGNLDLVKKLLDRGADVNITGSRGDTALIRAADNDYVDIARLLLNKGAKVNDVNSPGATALKMAVEENRSSELIRLLLEAGADPNIREHGISESIFLTPIRNNRVDVVKLLIEKGANINEKGFAYGKPLTRAKHGGNIEIIQLLESAGAKE